MVGCTLLSRGHVASDTTRMTPTLVGGTHSAWRWPQWGGDEILVESVSDRFLRHYAACSHEPSLARSSTARCWHAMVRVRRASSVKPGVPFMLTPSLLLTLTRVTPYYSNSLYLSKRLATLKAPRGLL